jgi:hypothetical protein
MGKKKKNKTRHGYILLSCLPHSNGGRQSPWSAVLLWAVSIVQGQPQSRHEQFINGQLHLVLSSDPRSHATPLSHQDVDHPLSCVSAVYTTCLLADIKINCAVTQWLCSARPDLLNDGPKAQEFWHWKVFEYSLAVLGFNLASCLSHTPTPLLFFFLL